MLPATVVKVVLEEDITIGDVVLEVQIATEDCDSRAHQSPQPAEDQDDFHPSSPRRATDLEFANHTAEKTTNPSASSTVIVAAGRKIVICHCFARREIAACLIYAIIIPGWVFIATILDLQRGSFSIHDEEVMLPWQLSQWVIERYGQSGELDIAVDEALDERCG